ncbi:hypothetical protein GGU45_000062 [Niabella hirudinis]
MLFIFIIFIMSYQQGYWTGLIMYQQLYILPARVFLENINGLALSIKKFTWMIQIRKTGLW